MTNEKEEKKRREKKDWKGKEKEKLKKNFSVIY